jgi:hypothetical protein
MQSSGMLRRVALVRTDDSEERSASIIRETRIGETGTIGVTSNRRKLRRYNIGIYYIFEVCVVLPVTANVPSSMTVTLIMEALRPFETSVLTRAIRRNIQEDGIPLYYRYSYSKSVYMSINLPLFGFRLPRTSKIITNIGIYIYIFGMMILNVKVELYNLSY